jgi:TolA-binding protein
MNEHTTLEGVGVVLAMMLSTLAGWGASKRHSGRAPDKCPRNPAECLKEVRNEMSELRAELSELEGKVNERQQRFEGIEATLTQLRAGQEAILRSVGGVEGQLKVMEPLLAKLISA